MPYPVPWIIPGLITSVLCLGRVKGAALLLRREGDDDFLEVAENTTVFGDETQAGYREQAMFRVYQPGNYSCSYQTHGECTSSKPSRIVTIKKFGEWLCIRLDAYCLKMSQLLLSCHWRLGARQRVVVPYKAGSPGLLTQGSSLRCSQTTATPADLLRKFHSGATPHGPYDPSLFHFSERR